MSQLNTQMGRRLLALGLLAFAAAPAAQADGGVFIEQNGLVAFHMESNPNPNGWTRSTSSTGFTGTSYYRWDGPNLFAQPGAQGNMDFQFYVSNPGTYTLNIRNRHDDPNPTEANDIWVKMDNGHWDKVFSNNYTSLPYVGFWSWESRVEHTALQATFYLSTGLHTLYLSGRSNGFKVDRIHLALPNAPNATNINAPESLRLAGTSYGTAVQNSTGTVGLIEGRGTSFVQFNNLALRAFNVPANTFGVFLAARNQGFTANPGGSAGNLLLGANFGRFSNIVVTNPSGSAQIQANLMALPTQTGPTSAVPGDTWYFQFMHREPVSSNLTRGLAVTFE